MTTPLPVHTRVLAAIGLGLVVATAAAGLLIENVYADDAAEVARARASDLSVLAFVAPALAVSLLPRFRHSRRAQFVTLAALACIGYGYAFRVFGRDFNVLFVPHVAAFAAALYAFVPGFAIVASAVASRPLPSRLPRRTVAVLLLALAVPLAAMWVYYSLSCALGGSTPKEALLISAVEDMHLAYALDLVFIIPPYVLAAALLLRDNGWGLAIALVAMMAGIPQQLSYLTALLFQSAAGIPGARSFDWSELPILAVYIVAAIMLWRSVPPSAVQPGGAIASSRTGTEA